MCPMEFGEETWQTILFAVLDQSPAVRHNLNCQHVTAEIVLFLGCNSEYKEFRDTQ